jgi:CubicO group peptidase (beta-lactamase class C family)
MTRRGLPVLVLAASMTAGACAPSGPAPLSGGSIERIERLFASYDQPRAPGCNVGVARDGRLIYARSFGAADLDHGILNEATTRFPIGSMSKQFTAMVVALLAEDGILALDDDVRRWVPELPAYARPIRVRDLLQHTSGLRDYHALRFLSGTPPGHVDLDDVLQLLARQRGTHFVARENFEYSNSNYVLARVVAERASGRTLRRLAQERVFAPLGMRSTTWDETGTRIVPQRAAPYTGSSATGWRRSLGATLAGSGGIWATVEDLLRWDENFYHNRLGRGDPTLVRQAVEPSPASARAGASAGEETRVGYGYGIFLGAHQGRRIEWHAGRGPGHVGDMARYPQQHVSIFCLCNATVDTRFLVRAVADVVLGIPAVSSPADQSRTAFVALAPESVTATVGDYLNPATGTVWALRADPAAPAQMALSVAAMKYQLSATSGSELFITDPPLGWRLTVEPDAAGKPARLHLFEEGVETAHFDRLGEPPPPAELAAYAGTFDCDELDNPYTLRLEDGALRLETRLQPKGTLSFAGADRFVLSAQWFTLVFSFTRDPGKRVDGFRLDSGAANGFRFTKRSV